MPQPQLYLTWPTAGIKSPDRYALEALGAILAGPRTARLTKALVFDQQTAASVSARQSTNEDAGDFTIVVSPRGGKTLTELEASIDAIVERVRITLQFPAGTEGARVERILGRDRAPLFGPHPLYDSTPRWLVYGPVPQRLEVSAGLAASHFVSGDARKPYFSAGMSSAMVSVFLRTVSRSSGVAYGRTIRSCSRMLPEEAEDVGAGTDSMAGSRSSGRAGRI